MTWKPGQQLTVATVSGPKAATYEGPGRTTGVARVRWVHNGKIVAVDEARIAGSGRHVPAEHQPTPRPSARAAPVLARAVNRESAPRLQPVPKPAPATRSRDYLAFVREKPCMSCRMPGPSDPHHWGPRGLGQKTDDHRTVPLCRKCHDHFHDTGRLPYLDKPTTKVFLMQRMVDLLVEWAGKLESEG